MVWAKILLMVHFVCYAAAVAKSMEVLHFKNNGGFALLQGQGEFNSSSLSVCFRMRPDFFQPVTVFHTQGQVIKFPLLQNGYGVLYINNHHNTFYFTNTTLAPRKWHHVCYVYSATAPAKKVMRLCEETSGLLR